MKKLFAIMVLVLSFSALADQQRVSFSYSGFEGGNRSFYACDFVENQTESFLKLFGATEINVRCTGGIQPYGHIGPVFVRATFEAPVLVGNEMVTVSTVKGDRRNPACGLNTTIVRNLLPAFSNVKVLSKSDSCAFSTSNYSYTFEILK